MASLQYVGHIPDSDGIVVNKGYLDTRFAAIKVDNAYATNAANLQAGNIPLVTQIYVDAEDNTKAHKAAVDAADANYVPTTSRGAASGVASIGSDGYVPSGQLPTLTTDRVATQVVAAAPAGVSHTCSTTTLKEFMWQSLAITDPGYPYRILPFAIVAGGAGGSAPSPRSQGTGNYGRIAILDGNDNTLAGCVCSGEYLVNFHHAVPYATANATPSSGSVIYTGAQTIYLYISLSSGTTFTFYTVNFNFFALVYPAA